MQETMSNLGRIVNSPEFKKRSTRATDGFLKFLFKWIGITFKAIIDFIKSMIMMTIGK